MTCEQKEIIANIARNKINSSENLDRLLDEQLYKERYAVERTNAWMDSHRSVLNRFDTTLTSWDRINFLAFITLKKFDKTKKSNDFIDKSTLNKMTDSIEKDIDKWIFADKASKLISSFSTRNLTLKQGERFINHISEKYIEFLKMNVVN